MNGGVEEARVDGRRRRRDRNVDAVIDAVLDLLAEGEVDPGAAAIAERSGVSLRSLFRYFEDLGALAAVAVERQAQRAEDLFAPLHADGDLPERIDHLVAHRLEVHRRVGPVARAARLRAHRQPVIQSALDRRGAQLRAQLEDLFTPELEGAGPDREALLVALEVLTGLDALASLIGDRGMSPEQAAEVLRRGVTQLLRS